MTDQDQNIADICIALCSGVKNPRTGRIHTAEELKKEFTAESVKKIRENSE